MLEPAQTIWETLRVEFSDVPDRAQVTRLTVRLLLAATLGGVLGFDRERARKAAGLRTHMLVALGSALFVMIPQQAHDLQINLSGVFQGLLAGVGFLGAGTIVKGDSEHQIEGLTTAAGLWLTAAVGVAAGLGRESTAVLSTLIALLILSVLPRLAHAIRPPPSRKPGQKRKAQGPDDKA